MKKTIVTIIICLGAVGTAWGQVGVGFNLYAGGGMSLPMSDLKDLAKNGYNASAGIGYSPVPMLEFVGRYGYNNLKFEANDDENLTVAEYGVDLRANLAVPNLKFKPYALIGAGMAKYDYDQDLLDSVEPDTKFFYSFGAGLKMNLASKINFFVEGRYTQISVDDGDMNYVPVTAGLNISL